jgi:plastocyanin
MSLRLLRVVPVVLLLGVSILSCGRTAETTNPSAAKELDSPFLLGATSGSQNYIHAFAHTGQYPYHCKLHTTVNYREGGLVTVSAQGADSAFVSIFQGAFHPDTLAVKPGGQVRWQNFDDGTHHTVTSD